MKGKAGAGRFEHFQWLFPIAVTLHSVEEAIWLPSWPERHGIRVPWQPTAIQIRLALTFITAAACAVTWFSRTRGRRSGFTYLFLSYTFVMFLNVFVPHVPASVHYLAITPGVVTAVLINLPVTGLLLALALQEQVIPNWRVAALVFGVPLAVASGAAVAFATGFAER